MNLLSSAWDWVAINEHRETLAFIGGGFVVAIGGAWAAYLHFSKKPKESSTVTASGGGIAAGGNVSPTASSGGIAVLSTAPVTIGITLEQYEAGLKRREQEIRGELAQANAAGNEKRPLLEKQLSDIQAKLGNSEAALEDYKSKLAQAYQALDALKKEVLPDPLEQARLALQKGETSDAEALFQKVLSGGKEKAAYQLGQLAEERIDYRSAYQYYKQAAELQPDNPLYLNAAGKIDHAVGRYSEAEPLYRRALSIAEKTLRPEHPNVAQSFNNLALLYYAQGQYAQAEPLYRRALAI